MDCIKHLSCAFFVYQPDAENMEFEEIKGKQMNKSNLVNEVTKVVSNKSGPVNAYDRVL